MYVFGRPTKLVGFSIGLQKWINAELPVARGVRGGSHRGVHMAICETPIFLLHSF